MLALNALLLAASAFPQARIEIAGLFVHPINFGVALLFLAVAPRRLGLLPDRVLVGTFAFFGLFVISALLESRSLTPIAKFGSSVVTLLAAAMAVNSDATFRASAVGMAIAVGVISARSLMGMSTESLGGINPMQGIANENAFSLYALPSLLIATHLALLSDTPRLQRVILTISGILTVIALFSTANRSGWLGAVLISVLLSVRAVRRARKLLLLGAIVGFTIYLILSFGNVKVIEFNWRMTEEGYASDHLRVQLIQAGVEIGVQNPILGVSPQRLPYELARRVPVGPAIDAHNVFTLIFGGSGTLTLIALLIFGWSLWRAPPGQRAERSAGVVEAHFLMRCMLIVWCARGMFGGEVLYSPSFSLGLGLCVGLCLCRGVWPRRGRARAGTAGPQARRRSSIAPSPIRL